MITDTDLLKTFVDETREHLDKLEADLLAMEHTRGDKEMLNRIFRAVHSIKGSAGFFKFGRAISALSHVMEDLMAKVRDGLLSVHQDMVDALLAGKDKLRQMLDDLDRSETVDYSAEHAAIKALVESVVAAPGPGMPTAATPKPECPVSVEPPSAETTPAPDDLGGLTPSIRRSWRTRFATVVRYTGFAFRSGTILKARAGRCRTVWQRLARWARFWIHPRSVNPTAGTHHVCRRIRRSLSHTRPCLSRIWRRWAWSSRLIGFGG